MKRDHRGWYVERTGPRHAPYTPVPGRTFYDIRIGDRVIIERTGRVGTVVSKHRHHNGRRVRWDEPVFGVEEGWVALDAMRPYEDAS